MSEYFGEGMNNSEEKKENENINQFPEGVAESAVVENQPSVETSESVIIENQFSNETENTSEIPKWNPDVKDLDNNSTMKEKEKNKKIWLVPTIIGGSLIIAAIIVVLAFGLLNNDKKKEKSKETVIATTNTQEQEPASDVPSGYILTDVSGVVKDVMPAVVGVTSRTIVNDFAGNFRNINDIWQYFFGGGNGSYGFGYDDMYGYQNEGGTKEVDSGLGSGTIISKNDKELLILTSYHVVDGCSSLYVTFTDGNAVDGTIKSASEEKDIAIVAVPLSDIPEETMSAIKIATLSTSDVNVGQGCIVIGNALGYGMSVTTGIISAVNRDFSVEGNVQKLIQTDAAINGGNSGGCMLNAKGEVIGISEAKLVDNSIEGMCYAIPISINSELIQNLLNGTSEIEIKKDAQGAYLGIQGRDVDQTLAVQYDMPQGIYVAGVVKGGSAEAAGIKEGDIIVSMDKVTILTMDALKEKLSTHNPGDEVTIVIKRKDKKTYKEYEVKATLTSMLS